MARKKTSDKIIDAALRLAAELPWSEVTLSDIAENAGVSLADLRDEFDDKQAVLAGFARRIDREVLAGIDADLAGEPPRERLFDIMLSRFDVLAPHKEAVRSIARSFRERPGDALLWNPVATRSMGWMLEAAGISPGGRMGALRAQGLALTFARVMRIWLDDDDPGMARTMAALDRRLREGESWLRRAEMLCAIPRALSRGRRRRTDRADEAPAEAP